MIDLESARVWCPPADEFGEWLRVRFLLILGWILVPIGIVVITDVLEDGSQ
jgi:hypothetical protein